MKLHPAIILSGIVTVFAIPARGIGIDLLSTALDTHGDWREVWVIGEDDTGTYHSNSGAFSNYVEGIGASSTTEVSSLQKWEYAKSSIDAFGFDMNSSSSPGGFPLPGGHGGLSGQEINIYSTATSRFNVTGTRLFLSITGFASYNYEDWEQDIQVTLRNVTSGIALLDLSDLDRYSDVPFAYDYFYNVDPSDEYELILSGRINSWDAKNVSMQTSIGLYSVADAGSTFAFSALAFLAVVGGRRLRLV